MSGGPKEADQALAASRPHGQNPLHTGLIGNRECGLSGCERILGVGLLICPETFFLEKGHGSVAHLLGYVCDLIVGGWRKFAKSDRTSRVLLDENSIGAQRVKMYVQG